jgi:hypothetical protein
MNHLTETQLNEYLDGIMEAPEQDLMQAHLSDCADCRARLAALQTVFKALAALPEETPRVDLTLSILRALPRGSSGLGWRLAFAMQAGISLGFLLLIFPFILGRIATIIPGWNVRIALPEMKFPNPVDFTFSLLVNPLPHPPILPLPVNVTNANLSIWLILGIAAVLLFVIGNFSLLFHSSTKP